MKSAVIPHLPPGENERPCKKREMDALQGEARLSLSIPRHEWPFSLPSCPIFVLSRLIRGRSRGAAADEDASCETRTIKPSPKYRYRVETSLHRRGATSRAPHSGYFGETLVPVPISGSYSFGYRVHPVRHFRFEFRIRARSRYTSSYRSRGYIPDRITRLLFARPYRYGGRRRRFRARRILRR